MIRHEGNGCYNNCIEQLNKLRIVEVMPEPTPYDEQILLATRELLLHKDILCKKNTGEPCVVLLYSHKIVLSCQASLRSLLQSIQ